MILGLITGSGFDELGPDDQLQTVETAYGPTVVCPREQAGATVYVLPRHAPGHTVPPHRINYRANIAALRDLGCRAVLATNAVGSLRWELPTGTFVVPEDFLDQTHQRAFTFFDGEDGHCRHTDMTIPYCPSLRELLQESCAAEGVAAHPTGTYLCTEGPRFETPAEIRMFAAWGADLVGMTGVPEVVLAREAGLCYATLCVVTNLAAGLAPGRLSGSDIQHTAEGRGALVHAVLARTLARVARGFECDCARR